MNNKLLWQYTQYLLENCPMSDHERAQLIVSQDCLITGFLNPDQIRKIKKMGRSIGVIPWTASQYWIDHLKLTRPTIKSYPKLRLV